MQIKINIDRLNYAKSTVEKRRRTDSGAELFSNSSYKPAALLHNSCIVRVSRIKRRRYVFRTDAKELLFEFEILWQLKQLELEGHCRYGTVRRWTGLFIKVVQVYLLYAAMPLITFGLVERAREERKKLLF